MQRLRFWCTGLSLLPALACIVVSLAGRVSAQEPENAAILHLTFPLKSDLPTGLASSGDPYYCLTGIASLSLWN